MKIQFAATDVLPPKNTDRRKKTCKVQIKFQFAFYTTGKLESILFAHTPGSRKEVETLCHEN